MIDYLKDIDLKFKDEIRSGVIFDPIKNEIFYAQKISAKKDRNVSTCGPPWATGGTFVFKHKEK